MLSVGCVQVTSGGGCLDGSMQVLEIRLVRCGHARDVLGDGGEVCYVLSVRLNYKVQAAGSIWV